MNASEGQGTLTYVELQRRSSLTLKDMDEIDQQDKCRCQKSGILDSIKIRLERNEFVNYCQPRVDIENGVMVGVEASIRWLCTECGLLSPSVDFDKMQSVCFPIKLYNWKINQALALLNIWRKEGLSVAISVEFTDDILLHPGFLKELSDQMKACPDIPGLRLGLEFLEARSSPGGADLRSTRHGRKIWVNISIDELGNDINLMRDVRVLTTSVTKIDRSIVKGVSKCAKDLGIVRSSLALGNTLGCQVVAEGVETEADVNTLIELGCRHIQGSVVAPPMPAEQLLPWLNQWRNNPPSWAPWCSGSQT